MIVRKIALPRRTFLRGVSATLALPLLDAMIPALTAAQKTAATPVRRLGFVYVPMGTHQPLWTPKQEGKLTELSPILAVSDTVHRSPDRPVEPRAPECLFGRRRPHTPRNAAFLSGVKAKRTDGSDYELGTTIDQIAARQISTETPLPSLELATDFNYVVGNCDNGYGCVYMNTMAWSSPTSPLPTEANPRVVFERMFGDGGTLTNGRRICARREHSGRVVVRHHIAAETVGRRRSHKGCQLPGRYPRGRAPPPARRATGP